MNGERFDTLLREVATPTSRRRIVGGVLGGVAALVAGTAVITAKPGKGKAKGRTKLSYCHQTGNGSYRFVTVGAPSAHSKHEGDILCTPPAECLVASGCDDANATCTFETAPEGTPCDIDPLVAEACDADGACVAIVVTP